MVYANQEIEEGLISVIMSNYNTPRGYLKESIESILNQSYPNFEFIIVDDASTDDSWEYLNSFSDARIRLIRNGENRGLTYSLNRALEQCRGEYVARMDSDDISLPQRFERQIAFMRDHPDVIVSGTWFEFLDERNNQTKTRIAKESISDRESYRIRLLFGNSPTILHPSACFNRRLLLKFGIRYREKYRYAQDYRMWVDCANSAECDIVPEMLVKYRVHEKAISVDKLDEQTQCAINVIQEQLDALHLEMPEDVKRLHHGYFYKDRYSFRMELWLRRILRANRRYRVYDQKKLKEIVWTRWRGIRRNYLYWTCIGIQHKIKTILGLED